MFIVIQNRDICVTQQVNRDYPTKFEMQKLRLHSICSSNNFESAGAVSSLRLSQSQASRQGKGKLLQSVSTQALVLFVPLQVVALKTEHC